jgi:surface polysaccharide O-acyltransferase-like enzyme
MTISHRRIESIDVMRVLSMVAVIGLHTASYTGPNAVGQHLGGADLLNQIERFAVPFFFIISGYLWADRCVVPEDYWTRAVALSKRALLIFLFWSLVYAVGPAIEAIKDYGPMGPLKILYWALRPLNGLEIASKVSEGTRVHLWFLPALALAAAISGALLARGRQALLFSLAILLFIVGLAGSAYADSPLGFKTSFNFRNGPFFSLIMFATGYWVQRHGSRLNHISAGGGFAIVGFLLQLLEVTWIRQKWGVSLSHDYVVGTYFFGLGMAMLALSNSAYLRVTALASIGPLILGVYASHFLFVDVLRSVDDALHGVFAWDIGYVAIVFALSLATTVALSRFAQTRRFVT